MSKNYSQDGFSIVEILIAVVVLVIIGVLGWKFYDAKFNKASVSNVSEKAAVDIVPTMLDGLADIAVIQKDAIADKSGVTVTHIELEQNDVGNLVYKTELSDGTVTIYDAKTGARVKSIAKTEKTTEVLPANFTPRVGFAKALEVARAEKPNSKVFKIELELEGGIVVYSVRFSDQARVDVDAQNGTIVRTKAAKLQEATTEDTDQTTSSNSGSSTSKGEGSHNKGSAASVDNSNKGSSGSHDDSSSDDDHLSGSDDDDNEDDEDDGHHGGSSDTSSNSGKGSDRD